MDAAEDLLRRLACNDEKALSMVLSRRRGTGETELPPEVELLMELAAFLAVGVASLVAGAARLAAAFGFDLQSGSA